MTNVQLLTLFLSIIAGFFYCGYKFKRMVFVVIAAILLMSVGTMIADTGIDYQVYHDLNQTVILAGAINGTEYHYVDSSTNDSSFWIHATGIAFVLIALVVLIDLVDFGKGLRKKGWSKEMLNEGEPGEEEEEEEG